jgi:DNA-binding NarL/FixJ family response regulator
MDGGERWTSGIETDSRPPLTTELGMQTQELRCVYVTISLLLSSIISEALSRRIALRLLAQLDDREGLAAALEALQPDLVVIGLTPGESDDFGASLLARIPRTKILIMGDTGDYACLYEMRLHRGVLLDFSPDNLVAAILAP